MAVEWDVFTIEPGIPASGDDGLTFLATLYDAREKSIRVELDGPGSGSFAIPRRSTEATETILAKGNLVKVRLPEVDTDYVFAFFIETGDFTLLSTDEEGGELLRFGGRGILSYLEYGVAWSESFIIDDPFDGLWRAYAAGTGSAPGQILARVIAEMQDSERPQQPIPLLTYDFDYINDSDAAAWTTTDATDEFTYRVGEDGLSIAKRLVETDAITILMDPDFSLHAHNSYGRDLAGDAFGAGVVRFEKGINIATELRRELGGEVPTTHILVAGETDHYGTAALSDAASRVTREGFLTSYGIVAATLAGVGSDELRRRLQKIEHLTFPITARRTDLSLADPTTVGSVVGPGATDGYYLPGPEGTANGDFWIGDTVRLHTGINEFDFNETDAIVEAITIARDDDNHELIVIPEVRTIPPVPGQCGDGLDVTLFIRFPQIATNTDGLRFTINSFGVFKEWIAYITLENDPTADRLWSDYLHGGSFNDNSLGNGYGIWKSGDGWLTGTLELWSDTPVTLYVWVTGAGDVPSLNHIYHDGGACNLVITDGATHDIPGMNVTNIATGVAVDGLGDQTFFIGSAEITYDLAPPCEA